MLQHYLDQVRGSSEFAELTLTDRAGLTAITAGQPLDFVQSDEEWWQVARGRGRSGGPRQFGRTAGATSRDSGVPVNAPASADINVFELGGRYNWGKNWVSLGWIDSKSPGSKTVSGDNKSDVLLASYRRDLGPGVQYRFSVFYANFKGEHPGSTDDSTGYAVTTSVRIAF